jgi:hypothetical protein
LWRVFEFRTEYLSIASANRVSGRKILGVCGTALPLPGRGLGRSNGGWPSVAGGGRCLVRQGIGDGVVDWFQRPKGVWEPGEHQIECQRSAPGCDAPLRRLRSSVPTSVLWLISGGWLPASRAARNAHSWNSGTLPVEGVSKERRMTWRLRGPPHARGPGRLCVG